MAKKKQKMDQDRDGGTGRSLSFNEGLVLFPSLSQ